MHRVDGLYTPLTLKRFAGEDVDELRQGHRRIREATSRSYRTLESM